MASLPPRIVGVITRDALPAALEVAVPLWMIYLSQADKTDRLRLAQADAMRIASIDEVAGQGGALDADTFAALARALAIGALAPGGIHLLGLHWCADHGRCQDNGTGVTA